MNNIDYNMVVRKGIIYKMDFETFRSQLIDYARNDPEMANRRRKIIIEILEGKHKRVNNVDYFNVGTDLAMRLLNKGEILFKEYTNIYYSLENYF